MLYLAVILAIILLAAILFFVAEQFAIKMHGDCNIYLDIDKISDKKRYEDESNLVFQFDIPFVNTGKQHGLIIDCDVNLQPKGDQRRYDYVETRIFNKDSIRFDGYWDGVILKPSKSAQLRIILKATPHDMAAFKESMADFKLDVRFRHYGRGLMQFHRTELSFKSDEFEEVTTKLDIREQFPPKPRVEREIPETETRKTSPVKTHILMPGESLTEIIQKYIPNPKEGEIFTIAESALAIIQKRVYYVDDVHPSSLAVRLSNFLNMDSSLSSPYSMQKAMDEVGAWRLVLAVYVGILGKLLRRGGDFYRIAGKPAAVIDDCTGTIPPFDKYVVMGPSNMVEELNEVKKATGMDAAVVDVNDLHRVDVLATTAPDRVKHIENALEWNPGGNGNEQTPIVLIHSESKA